MEVRVNDMLNARVLMPKEALDCLTSFAISEEGTNTLYLGLIDVVARRDHIEQPYTL
jgi:hypothetical protein